jgi:hypothetical protein
LAASVGVQDLACEVAEEGDSILKSINSQLRRHPISDRATDAHVVNRFGKLAVRLVANVFRLVIETGCVPRMFISALQKQHHIPRFGGGA